MSQVLIKLVPEARLEILNKDYEHSVINLVSPSIQSAISHAADLHPEYFGPQADKIIQKAFVANTGELPTQRDNCIRIAFWKEYDRAQIEGVRMRMNLVLAGVMDHSQFLTRWITAPHNVAWMLTPPLDYKVRLEDILDIGMEKIREAMRMPLMGPNGKIDPVLSNFILKMMDIAEKRLYGAVATKNLNVNVDATPKQNITGESMAELQKRLKALEKLDAELTHAPILEIHGTPILET